MSEICPKCGTFLTKKDEYCPVCTAHVQSDGTDKKKTPSKRLIRALPYLIDVFLSLTVLICTAICKIRAKAPLEVISKYGVFSPEAVKAERYVHLLGTLNTVFSVLIIIFTILALYCLISKPKEKTKFNTFVMGFTLLLVITLSTASVAYNKHYAERDRIEILAQNELEFSLPGIYCDEIQLSESFQNNLYTYYVSFACAYNDLVRSGNYNGFFEEICKENFPSLDYQLTALKEAYVSQSKDVSKTGVITSSDISYSHLPGESLSVTSLPSLDEMEILVASYSQNNMVHSLADKCITNANLLFDLFCGKELINEKEVTYNAEKYKGTYSHSVNKNCLKILSLSLDEKGNGKIRFNYSSVKDSLDCKVTNRKARFRYKDKNNENAYGMIHITEDIITVNIWEQDRSSFMKSDSFPLFKNTGADF